MLRLTEQEQQEIIRFIEADKPLPDKYRFLLFEDKREVELVWNGKTNEVCNIVLPFQTIEQVDEPRAEKPEDTATQADLFAMDNRGRQLKGWTNKLIWGDNKLILSSLKNGPLREEIEKQGGLKLIYIDPPFDVGADFSMDIEIGDDTFTKKPNILEEIAYRDTWGKGADSFIAMIYERLMLMRDLLAEDGSIFGFEFEMGLFPNVLDEARGKGIDIAPKYIPAEVFDKRAVEKNQVVFHDVSFIEVKPHVVGARRGAPATVAVELTDFSVFYSQDSIAHAEATLKNKGSKIVVEKGQIVKVSKDKDGIVTREQLTTPLDRLDRLLVGRLRLESKREIIRVRIAPETQEAFQGMGDAQLSLATYEEQWTGDYVFENEWQCFRTKKDRSLELVSVPTNARPAGVRSR